MNYNLNRIHFLTLASMAFLALLAAPDVALAANATPAISGLASFAPLLIIIVIFYFLLIRPQQKRLKAHNGMIDELKKGDKIITAGGIIGTIHDVTEDVVKLNIADKVRITIKRDTITSLADQT